LRYHLEEAKLPPRTYGWCLLALYLQGIDAPGLDSVAAAEGWPFWNGILAADQGRWGAFEADVRTRRDSASAHLAAGDTVMAAGWENRTRVMEGYREWKHGQPDRLVEALEALPLSARSLPSARWWLGLAYLELGRSADAIRMFETFWGWTRWPIAKFHEGEAYEQMGDPEKAREAYATFVDAWKDADPELQPWVDRGRAALARLGPLDQ
jgi:tetratricopeptide (TPR) repeat protein